MKGWYLSMHLVKRSAVIFTALFLILCASATTTLLTTHTAHAASVKGHAPAKASVQILPGAHTTGITPLVTAPAATTSIYESTTSASTLQSQGCSAASTPGLVVLDWGEPDTVSGAYGTYDFGGVAVSDTTILHAVANFALGVWDCRTSATNLAIAVGQSNYGSAIALNTTTWNADGAAWGDLINNIQSYVVSSGYSNVIGIYGAGDLETEWNSFSVTSSMVQGYNGATTRLFFDFGDDTPGYWTNYDVWYVAWGAADDEPLPEIYYNADATEDWGPLATWSCANGYGTMDFKGTMSEAVSGTASPSGSFDDMYNALGTNSCTAAGRSSMIFETVI